MITVAPECEKIITMCLVQSYCLLVWGNRLEGRKNEKKMNKYRAINVTLCSRPADIAMTCCDLLIERP